MLLTDETIERLLLICGCTEALLQYVNALLDLREARIAELESEVA